MPEIIHAEVHRVRTSEGTDKLVLLLDGIDSTFECRLSPPLAYSLAGALLTTASEMGGSRPKE